MNDEREVKQIPVSMLKECKCPDPRPKLAEVTKRDDDPTDKQLNALVVCHKCNGWLPPSYGDRSVTVLEHYKRTLPELPVGSRVRRKIGRYHVTFLRCEDGWEYEKTV